MLFFKNNEIPDVAETCFRVSYCKLLFLSINSSAGLSGTTTQRPCLCSKVHAITASTALCCTLRRQSFISLQCKAQVQLHILVHITTFGAVNPQGRPVAPARAKPAPRPYRGCRRCRRAGGVSPRSGAALRLCRGLRGAALLCPHPSAPEREGLRYSESEKKLGGGGQGPARGITGTGSCHGSVRGSRRGTGARPAGTAGKGGREAGGGDTPRLYRSHRTGVCWLSAPQRSLVGGQRLAGALLILPLQDLSRGPCPAAAARPRLPRGRFRALGSSPRRGARLGSARGRR